MNSINQINSLQLNFLSANDTNLMTTEQTNLNLHTRSSIDFSKKEPFHFLKILQKQLVIENSQKDKIYLEPYKVDTQQELDLWRSFEKAILASDAVKVEEIRKQLFPGGGTLIKPEIEAIENPQTDSDKVVNIFHKNEFFKSKPIPEKLLSWGLGINNVNVVYAALMCGADPQQIMTAEGQENSLMNIAVEHCSLSIIRYMFQFAKSPSALANDVKTKSRFYSPLKIAFKAGRADAVRELLTNGADLDNIIKNQNIDTKFRYSEALKEEDLFLNAVKAGHVDLLQLFLKAGFPVNYQNTDGNTALHFALVMKHSQVVKDLLNAGANSELINKVGQNPKEYCRVTWNKWNEEACKKLVKAFETNSFYDVNRAGGLGKVVSYMQDINEPIDKKGNTLLHFILSQMVKDKNSNLLYQREVSDLIKLNADPLSKNNLGETPCDIYVNYINTKEGKILKLEELVEMFNKQDMDLRTKLKEPINQIVDPEGNIGLHLIFHKIKENGLNFDLNLISQAKELIEKGAYANYQNYQNKTPKDILYEVIDEKRKLLNDYKNYASFLKSKSN